MIRRSSTRRAARSVPGLFLTLFLLPAPLLLFGCSAPPEAAARLWTCPMHPEQISDRPGRCPVCKMDLVPKGEGKHPDEAKASEKASEDLQPGKVPDDSQDSLGAASPVAEGPAFRASGVETEAAREESTGRTVRATATVLPDERRITQVHARTAGWVEKLYVNAPGQRIRRGEAMLEIHAPELVASQEDYLRARAAQARFAGSSLPEVRQGGAELVAAARRRLALLGVPEGEIARLEASGRPRRTVRLDAPASGYVQEKTVFEGAQVEPGTALFRIVDLSRVWLEASFPESDAWALRAGLEARVRLPSDPGRGLVARATFVDPSLDPATRTLKVRFDVANPDLALKPGMSADLEAILAGRLQVTVPATAVLGPAERRQVFVETAPGRFEPRRIEVGPTFGGRTAVAAGLRAGERVAARASFLLDSESRLPPAPAGPPGGEPVP